VGGNRSTRKNHRLAASHWQTVKQKLHICMCTYLYNCMSYHFMHTKHLFSESNLFQRLLLGNLVIMFCLMCSLYITSILFRWAEFKMFTNNDLQNIHTLYKTKDWVTRTPLKTGGELRCCRRTSSDCSNLTNRNNFALEIQYGRSLKCFMFLYVQ
jgi:hypothetical protein